MSEIRNREFRPYISLNLLVNARHEKIIIVSLYLLHVGVCTCLDLAFVWVATFGYFTHNFAVAFVWVYTFGHFTHTYLDTAFVWVGTFGYFTLTLTFILSESVPSDILQSHLDLAFVWVGTFGSFRKLTSTLLLFGLIASGISFLYS